MSGWVFRIGIIAVIAIGAFIFRDRLSGSPADLQVGDCFDVPTANVDISDVQHHPCTESHTGEVFAVISHPAAKGTPPLTEPQLVEYLGTACVPLFAAYVGQEAVSAGVLDFGAFYPRDEDWNDGDRGVTCYAYRVDDGPMTTSVKKAP
ncbi:MAG TPA: septum formation family protein [Candidatus Limnocylindrales bacterium]|nr:septum formation family protein [Candidatus Limnocylindrales bacterium]